MIERPTGYTGPAFTPKISDLIKKLRAERFRVETGKPGRNGKKEVLRVLWGDYYVGLIDPKGWNVPEDSPAHHILGYRFGADQRALDPRVPGDGQEAVDFMDAFKFEFARENGCSPSSLRMHPERQKDRTVHYLQVRDVPTALMLMRRSAALLDGREVQSSERDDPEAIAKDVADVRARVNNPTTQKRLVDARLGQGGFRTGLISAFRGKCALTHLSVQAVLRASHIVAWGDPSTNDVERLDPHNGLLLSANWDALFDRHLIAFREDGIPEISRSLTPDHLEEIGPVPKLSVGLGTERVGYLRRHLAIFEEKERGSGPSGLHHNAQHSERPRLHVSRSRCATEGARGSGARRPRTWHAYPGC